MKKPVILCIDDEVFILEILKLELEESLGKDYTIELADSGEEAIGIVDELVSEEVEIPLVITDYIMPGMRGDEVLKVVHKKIPGALKVMLTGQASLEGLAGVINSVGLYRFLSKPWDKIDMLVTIKEALKSYQDKKSLRITQVRLQAIMDHASTLISFKDLNGVYLLQNRQFESKFQSGEPARSGVTDYDIFPPEIAEKIRINDREVLERGVPLQFEEDTLQDGKICTYLSTKFPLLDQEGKPYGISGISADITERKKHEREKSVINEKLEERVEKRTAELTEANRNLEFVNKELESFSYSVSHDLRAPLRGIEGFSRMLEEDYGDVLDEEGRRYLHKIQENVERITY